MEAGLDSLLRRDRAIVLAALSLIVLLAWGYVVHLASQMDMGGMDMSGFRMATTATGMIMTPAFQPWTTGEFLFTFAMWAVMMIGMMTPSAAPIILLYARVGRDAARQGKPFASTGWFAGGYVLMWAAFSLAATAAQWGLDRAALLTPTMASASGIIGGAILLAAGLYQWTSFKDTCLKACESPLQFIMRNGGFRKDIAGSLRLGIRHGLYCVGCCWALMTLLFVGGVMNVLWIALISVLVLAEKALSSGRLISRLAGAVFIVAGLGLLVDSVIAP
jgi:predicted metal-binding membrane protein